MSRSDEKYDFLYPSVKSNNFNLEITKFKEFNDYKYDGTIPEGESQDEREKQFLKMVKKACNQSQSFTLEPHQQFVKNFLSSHTPYKSLLLYHGLGTGKTCSAVGIAEQFRKYSEILGYKKNIYFVGSKNIRDNFKNELFKLKQFETIVTDALELDKFKNLFTSDNSNKRILFAQYVQNKMNGCNGGEFLKEINFSNILSDFRINDESELIEIVKDRIYSKNGLINSHYVMESYHKFSNHLLKYAKHGDDENFDERSDLNNSLIIIDEAHNAVSSASSSEEKEALLIRQHPECEWINLQVDASDEQQQILEKLGVRLFAGMIRSFDDTAALISNLDVVISVDTAVAHLAAALGRPTWLMLNWFAACWRWLTARDDSPWYSTMRIFRQPQQDDWKSVTDKITQYLRWFKV